MKRLKDYSTEELRTLLLEHLEGALSPEEEREVLRLLQESPEASRELEALKRLVHTLETDKTVFCPDLAAISEFVSTGHDPSGTIAGHLKECPSCREEAESIKSFRPAATIPPKIWNAVRSGFRQQRKGAQAATPSEGASTLWKWFSSLFRVPVLAVGSAVALALLLVVFLYPSHQPVPILALSTVSWQSDLTTKIPIMPRGRELVAVVILLKNFRTAMSQPRIDSLYEALKPSESEQQRYDLANPARIKETLEGAGATNNPLKENVRTLHEKLGIQRVVAVTLVSEENRIRINCELIDATSGRPIGTATEAMATDQTLESTLKNLVYGSLNLTGNGNSRQ